MNQDKNDKEDDPIIVHIGDMGRYQFWFCMLIILANLPIGWVSLSHIFLAAPTKYECVDPVGADPCSANCSKAEHNRSVFEETIVTEFKLVCKTAWMSSLTQTFVMLGMMLGNLSFGILADKIGRRPPFLISMMAQIVCGFIVSLSNWYWFYAASRFAVAFATGGTMTTSFILIMEILGSKKRTLMAIIYHLFFYVGHATLPLFSYYFRHWRWFNLCYSSLCALLVINLCLGIESPRWYFTTGRLDESIALLEKVARANGKPTENIRPQIQEAYNRKNAQSVVRKGALQDLFRTPNLRMKTIVLAYLWVDVCMVYIGVSQYISTLSGNIFINVAISAMLAIFGAAICIFIMQCMGRRYAQILANYLGASSLLLIAVTPQEYTNVTVGLASIGLCAAAMLFIIVYLYTTELFPTVVRNSGMGLCSFVGRLGSMIAPHISDLAHVSYLLPPCIFGAACLLGGTLTFLLPETSGFPLPETIEDGENFGKKAAKNS